MRGSHFVGSESYFNFFTLQKNASQACYLVDNILNLFGLEK